MPEAILVADDEPGVRESLAEILRDAGYTVQTAADGSAALKALEEQDFGLVVTDLRMPGADGLAVLKHARDISPQTLVLVMTAHGTVDTAVEALRAGAADYILKPVVFDDLLSKVARLVEHRQIAWQMQMLRREVDAKYDFQGLVGASGVMRAVMDLVRKVAPTQTTVLITGESGTGKEVVARAIHQFSERAQRILLPVNCAAIPENLLESQLFGHVRGAFTGAVTSQEGLISRAKGGTIFLDEIGDMPFGLQSKLLRAIESKEILPVGSTQPVTVDVRIIAASNHDLRKMVDEGKFREDLYYRLNVVNIQLPPLRDRREDIPSLLEYLVRRHNREMKRGYKGVDNATLKVLMSQPWKGNVRELDNVIEHAMILGNGEWITVADLPRALRESDEPLPPVGDELREALRAYERIHIDSVLRRAGHDKRKAADMLGLSLSSLYRKLNELGIELGNRPDLPGRLRELTGLDEAHRAERLAFFELGDDDASLLLGYRALAQTTVDGVVADFYAHLLKFPELETLLRSEPGRIAKLQGLQREYFLSLAGDRFDADYFESRLRVGDAHQRIGLRPAWYIGAFALYLRLALRALVADTGDGARILPTVEALIKAIFLDMSLAMNTYIYGGFVEREVAAELERAARAAEDALEARAEVERLKDDLTNMVVHDLKNPVNGIAMMIQLALRKGRELPEAQRGYLLQIDRTCREMMRLIQNLLEISKIEEGKMPVAREPIVLAELADEVAREYQPVAEQAGRQLRIAVGTELPPAIGDRTLLKRVLVNLVVNALRHSGSREVVVEARSVLAEVTLNVIDFGQGIAEADQTRIFEKFRTVRRSPSDDPGGDTGLGLPFCKLAIERMGGRIALASTGDVSTVFAITLPALGTD